MLDTTSFLSTVVTGKEGWFCLAYGNNGHGWKEEWYRWPNDLETIAARAQDMAAQTNVYFSSYLFSDKSTTKDHVLPTRTIQADLDEADINQLPVQPNVLVQTSPSRHQAYWILDHEVDLEIHEILSRKLTYSIPACDRSGWPLGRKVRVANTTNYKYLDGPKPVRVVSLHKKEVDPEQLELLPDIPRHVDELADEEFLSEQEVPSIGPQELLNAIKEKIPPTVYLQYNIVQPDRSAALWALLCSAFRAGLSRAEVFHLGKHSANNKFAGLRYHAERELAKDVLRAEAVIQAGKTDTRTLISQARKLAGPVSEKRRYMLELIQEHMQYEGTFFHTADDLCYYVRNDIGRPISISSRSEYLYTLLDMEFGLNPTEPEHQYVVHGLVNWTRTLPVNARSSTLSYFDEDTNMIMIHGARSQVFEITANYVRTLMDGAHSLVFPWHPSNEQFRLDRSGLPDGKSWDEVLFHGTTDNVIGVDPDEARVLLKVWLLFTLMRSAAISRPILALFGQPGSGKSTMFRRIYALLYGKTRGLSAVTTSDNFDYAVASDPLVVLDNVDTWAGWLPDRLAASISNIDIIKRKLYTDDDIVVLKRQAIIAITAHNPQFGREDVTDRLLILTMTRIPTFISDAEIIEDILKLRNKMWGSICNDLQTVLATPRPDRNEVPQMRVEDFARVGFWIARALKIEDKFTSVIKKIRRSQKLFSVEEEQMLVDAIVRMIAKDKGEENWRSAGQLWSVLSEIHAQDPLAFQRRYKNSILLGKKLWSLMDPLKEVFDVKFEYNTIRQTRMWLFKEKTEDVS